MPILHTIGSAASRAYGFLRTLGSPSLVGNYLYMWGITAGYGFGQGGVSAAADRSSPVQIGNLSYTSIAAGNSNLAVRSDGTLWGWGQNNNGCLGIGSTNVSLSVVQVGTLTNWSKVFASLTTVSGAIKTDGTLWTWGLGTNGVLGNGATTSRSSPIQIGTLTDWSTLAFGNQFCLAIKTDGTLWSWGNNASGQLGSSSVTSRSSPVQVGTLTNWAKVAGGGGNGFAAAIKTDGTLWMWGDNGALQLGSGTTVSRSSPVQVGTLTNWSKISVSPSGVMATKTDGTMYVWGLQPSLTTGLGGTYGATGSTLYTSFIPLPNTWNSVTQGSSHAWSLGIASDNTLWSWGYNGAGQLGNSSLTDASYPIQIGSLTWLQSASAASNGGGVRSDNTIWTWGAGNNGILGTGNTTSTSSPVQVGTLTNWSSLSFGNSHAVAVKTTGTLWSWGLGTSGQLGNNTTTSVSSPIQVGTLTNWSKAAGGSLATWAVKTDGTLWAWGRNPTGQLGDGTTVDKSSPIQIGTLTNWASVYAGVNNITCAIKTDGTAWVWGLNSAGQLGLGDTVDRSSPVQLGTLTSWVSAYSGNQNLYWIRSDNTVWGAGYNALYVLNTGNTLSYSSPVQVYSAGTGAMGYQNTTFVLGSDKVMRMIGKNWDVSGLGSPPSSGADPILALSYPAQVGTLTTWNTPSIKSSSLAVAVKTDGTLWTWGIANYGQYGYGDTTTQQLSPRQVGTQTYWVSGDGQDSATASTFWNSNGQIFTAGRLTVAGGQVLADPQPIPVQVGTTTTQKFANAALVSGSYAAIDASRQLWTWGDNTYGQLGNSTTGGGESLPTQQGSSTDWNAVYSYTGASSIQAVKTDGTLWTWGRDASGFLGIGATPSGSTQVLSPSQLGNVAAAKYATAYAAAQANSTFALMVSADGKLYSTGFNNQGQLGNGNTVLTSTVGQVGTLSTWSDVAATASAAAAIKTDGTLWMWGGIAGLTSVSSPVQLGTTTTWSKIYADVLNETFYAIKVDGSLWAWGSNGYTTFGDGTLGTSTAIVVPTTPVLFKQDSLFTKTAVARDRVMFVGSNNRIWGSGQNASGCMGIGSTVNVSSPTQVGSAAVWADAALGEFNGAFIRTDGTLWTSGSGSASLGDGSTTTRSSPVQVGTVTTWSSVVMQNYNVLATRTDGTLWSWGPGAGAMGQGNTLAYSVPTQVGTLTNWSKVYLGGVSPAAYALAIKTDGTLWSWGDGGSGELGRSSTANTSSPQQVGTLTNWSSLGVTGQAAGVTALKTDGTIWAWGNNTAGRLGDGTTVNKSSPVQIGTLTTWSDTKLSVDNAYYLRNDNTLWASGSSSNGGLGTTQTGISSPIQIDSSKTWTRIMASYTGVFAQANGWTYTWGAATGPYPSRIVLTAPTSSPVQVGSLTNWSSPNIKTDGTLWTWGQNAFGENGQGDTLAYSTPTQVGTLTNWTTNISRQYSSTSAIKTDGTWWTWGSGANGRLGSGTTASRSSPVQVGTLTTWQSTATGPSTTSIVKSDYTLWGTGNSAAYPFAVATSSSPVQLMTLGTELSSPSLVLAGGYVMTNAPALVAWARASFTGFSDQRSSSVSSPTQIGLGVNWRTPNIRTNNTLWLWGTNSFGALGNGTTVNFNGPLQVGTLTDWASYESAVNDTSAAIKTDGSLWTWGYGLSGALGSGATTSRSSPVQVGTLTNWSKLAGRSRGFHAIKTDGTLWGWGSASSGVLGNGTTTDVSSPVQIGTLTNWVSIASTDNTTMVGATSDGKIWSWGSGTSGALGTGSTVAVSSPVQIGTNTTWQSVVGSNTINNLGAFRSA